LVHSAQGARFQGLPQAKNTNAPMQAGLRENAFAGTAKLV
jgi:hypothetical protein